jgi:hypothetical protein
MINIEGFSELQKNVSEGQASQRLLLMNQESLLKLLTESNCDFVFTIRYSHETWVFLGWQERHSPLPANVAILDANNLLLNG